MCRAGDRADGKSHESRNQALSEAQLCPREEDEAERILLFATRGDQERLPKAAATVTN